MKNQIKFNAVFTTVALIVGVIIVNMIVGMLNSKMPLKIDLTRENVYKFSEQTKTVMKNLDKEVNVYALYPDDASGEYVDYIKEYLSKYKSLSDKFILTYVDPYKDPNFVNKYTSEGDAVDVGSIIVTCGEQFKVISFAEMYEQDQYTNRVSIDMEKKVTSAILNVTGKGNNTKVLFTTGHSEYDMIYFKECLTDEGYICESVNLLMNDIPEDANVLVIGDPTNDFALEEINKIDAFTDKGGKVMVVAQSGKIFPSNIAKYISDWGFKYENDFIIEKDTNHSFQSQYGVSVPAPIMLSHEITDKLISAKKEFMSPMTRSISITENNIYGVKHTPLMQTTNKSFGKVDLESESQEKAPDDNKGPLNVAVLGERFVDMNTSSKMVVIGSLASIESPVVYSQSSYANSDFILNTFAYLTGNTMAMDIRAKLVSDELLTITETQVILVRILLLYVLPIVIFAIGIIVWWRRRYL